MSGRPGWVRKVRAAPRKVGPRAVSPVTPIRTTVADRERMRVVTARRRAAVVVLALVWVIGVAPTALAYLRQRQQIAALQDSVSVQQQRVKALRAQAELWRQDDYVMQQARERLKFVKVGEKSYTVIDANPSGVVDPTTSIANGASSGSWYGQLWDSLRLADSSSAARSANSGTSIPGVDSPPPTAP